MYSSSIDIIISSTPLTRSDFADIIQSHSRRSRVARLMILYQRPQFALILSKARARERSGAFTVTRRDVPRLLGLENRHGTLPHMHLSII